MKVNLKNISEYLSLQTSIRLSQAILPKETSFIFLSLFRTLTFHDLEKYKHGAISPSHLIKRALFEAKGQPLANLVR
ncbi:MAG: hypothetical protein NZ900_05785 [Synergistetes bacterium]|nr:hypothetical protein [Synergistota bacterium]MDW8192432.1 hypothetical protein [Synergistota bacterium]